MDPAYLRSDAATLLATLTPGKKRRSTIRGILSTWDMIQVGMPSRRTLEAAAGALSAARLITIDDDWRLSLTAEGARIRAIPSGWAGMRTFPSAIEKHLPPLVGDPEVTLPAELYECARDDYLRPRRGAPRWLRWFLEWGQPSWQRHSDR
ncbi:hypothetical protein J2X55_001867 [Microbacterium sp. 1154]|uniref:hypothetical protein n=1 Tax=Microbacterium sp. 1154 TaxID=2817733 RepID=UPI000E261291|nr:hypothetical protein [Microbacterium sp. 1154]MDR6690955.1 hypothetical protein [Microbacterium sp. 1154]